jgi:hypothetical protein
MQVVLNNNYMSYVKVRISGISFVSLMKLGIAASFCWSAMSAVLMIWLNTKQEIIDIFSTFPAYKHRMELLDPGSFHIQLLIQIFASTCALSLIFIVMLWLGAKIFFLFQPLTIALKKPEQVHDLMGDPNA